MLLKARCFWFPFTKKIVRVSEICKAVAIPKHNKTMCQYLAHPFCCQGEVYILSFSMYILQVFILYFSMYIFTVHTVCACLILTYYLGVGG